MKWVLFALMLPWTLTVGWPWVLLMTAIRAAGSLKFEGDGVLTAIWKQWAAKRWKYSTTLGSGIIYQEGSRHSVDETSIQFHEHIHVRQVQDQMAMSFILGFVICVILIVTTSRLPLATGVGMGIWWSGGLWQAANFLTSGIRNGWSLEGVYLRSEHEKAAYAQTLLRR